MKKLTASQILNFFPEESAELIPKQIKILEKKIKPYKKWIDDLLRKEYPDFDKWFIIECSKILGAPMKEMEWLACLKRIKRLMNSGDIKKEFKREEAIRKAKEVPFYEIMDFKKLSGRLWAHCPFHEEKTPSLMLNKNNTIYCFSCQFYGDTIEYMKKTTHCSFMQAVKMLANY